MDASSKSTTKLQLIVIISILSFILFFAVFKYYQQEKAVNKRVKYTAIHAKSKFKADQLSVWLKERMSEVSFFSSNNSYPEYIQQMILGNSGDMQNYRNALAQIFKDNRFQNIYVLDPHGKLVFSYDTTFTHIEPATLIDAKNAIQKGEILIQDLSYDEIHHQIHFQIFAPVLDNHHDPIATVVYRINPDEFIYPLIVENPGQNPAEESYIVKQVNDSVFYLSMLKDADNSRLRVAVPLHNTELYDLEAAADYVGFLTALNYAGHKVYSVVRKIPGTHWFLITEIESPALYAELNKLFVWLFSSGALFILLLVMVVSWIFNRRQSNHYKELLENRYLLFHAHEEFEATLYSIGDGVITTNESGQVKNLNPVAETLTGWKEADAKNKAIEVVFNLVNEITREIVESPVRIVLKEGKISGHTNHILLISKNETETPVSANGSPIYDKKGVLKGVVLVFKDQTEERLNTRLLEVRLNSFEYAIDHDLEQTLRYILDEIGTLLNSPVGFAHLIHPQTHKLWLTAWSSKTTEEYCRLNKDSLHDNTEVAGIWAEAVRLKQPVIHNDYDSSENKKGMPDGHAKITRQLVVPVIRGNVVVAVMGMGNKPVEYSKKDTEILWFLADVAWEIAEQKLKEKRIQQSEERFIHLFERAPLGYQSLDINGHLIEVNQAWTDTLGYSKNEVIGKWFGDFLHPDEVESFKERFSRFKKEGRVHSEMSIIHKNGDYRLIAFEGNIGYKDDGSFDKTHCIIRDITESKLLEHKLEENERRLSSLVNNLPGFVYRCICDENWTMLYLSAQCKNITGYDPEDLINNKKLSFNDLIKEEYKKDVQSKWKFAIDNRSEFIEEYEIITADNSTKWVSERGTGVYDKNGALLFLEGYIEDINDRKITELQLKESEIKFRNIFQGHVAVKLIIDPDDGKIFDANDAAAEFYGWSIEELTSMYLHQINPLPPDKILNNIWSAREKGKAHYEFVHKKANGELIEIESFSSTVIIGGKTYLYAIVHDISDRKKAENALRESEERNRLIMDNSLDAILLTKPDGTVLSANIAACAMFGMSEEEICNAGRDNLVDIEDEKLEEMLLIREKNGYVEGELNFVRKDGSVFPAEITSSIFQNKKGEFFTSMILRDITERKKWEEELVVAKEKAEQSDKLKSAFLTNMSHEIRTPMNGILGFLNLLKSDELDDHIRQEYIQLVNLSGLRLLDTINDIIEISKIEAGEEDVKRSFVDISEIMKYHVDFFSLQARQKKIEIQIAEQVLSPGVLVETDSSKLISVLSN